MRIFLILTVSFYLTGIAPAQAEESGPAIPSTASAEQDRSDMLFYALSLIGTAYKYGGDSPLTGMDCSGFVNYVYRNVTGLELPRTTQDLSVTGEPINEKDLRLGDLVFFNTMKRAFSHVGIYLGEHRFIHAPGSKTGEIMISDMTQKYWSMRFSGARRPTNTLSTPR